MGKSNAPKQKNGKGAAKAAAPAFPYPPNQDDKSLRGYLTDKRMEFYMGKQLVHTCRRDDLDEQRGVKVAAWQMKLLHATMQSCPCDTSIHVVKSPKGQESNHGTRSPF